MNAELLLKHFDRIAEEPDAVSRLRRFVLDLAVRGKLVEQDPEDESVGDHLGQIDSARAELFAKGAIKKERVVPRLEDDLPFDIPAHWVWVPFGRVHQLVRGVTYTKADVSEHRLLGYTAVLRANNIGARLTVNNPVFVKSGRVAKEQFLKQGDFMVALSSGSKALVGKAAYVTEDLDAAFGGFCGVIRLFSDTLEGYARVYLQSDLYRLSIAEGSRGTLSASVVVT